MTHLITRARAHLCADLSPPGYAGHWRDWHRGHDCELDPGAPNGARAIALAPCATWILPDATPNVSCA